MVSRFWRHIRTKETGTGIEKPWPGRISTLPSIRGYAIVGLMSAQVLYAKNGLRSLVLFGTAFPD
jgi:hypothetical protein